jgi:uncharacterized protein (DUF2141 family)
MRAHLVKLIATVSCSTWFAFAPAWAQSTAGQLTVELKGVANRGGVLACSLFASDKGFPMEAKHAVATAEGKKKENRWFCVFPIKTPGDYAVAVLHDENGNRKVDTNFLGIPREGWAASNDVKPALRAPTFAESRMKVTEPNTKIAVQMRY